MTSIELQLCDIQGRLFKLSTRRGISSAEFVKVFMKSATAKAVDSTYNRMQWAGGSRARLSCRQGIDLRTDVIILQVGAFLYALEA